MAVIAFFAHPDRQAAAELAARASSWLTARGHQAVPATQPDGTVSAAGADLLVSLGGDGMLLRAVGSAITDGVPVLGVNMGRLGYLTQIEPAGLEQALKGFLAGEHQVEERMTLHVSLTTAAGTDQIERLALNEAVVEKNVPGHTVRIASSIAGRPFMTYAADGLLVSTPTGSTAYNLSARGPVLSPRMRAIVLTPVSPHMLFDRALVLEPDEWVTLNILEPRPAVLVVDGHTVATLEPGATVTCREGARPARLVMFSDPDFHTILRAKFRLADW
jgi:NAD+ kinase